VREWTIKWAERFVSAQILCRTEYCVSCDCRVDPREAQLCCKERQRAVAAGRAAGHIQTRQDGEGGEGKDVLAGEDSVAEVDGGEGATEGEGSELHGTLVGECSARDVENLKRFCE